MRITLDLRINQMAHFSFGVALLRGIGFVLNLGRITVTVRAGR